MGKGGHAPQDNGTDAGNAAGSSMATSDLPAVLSEPRMAPFTSSTFDVATFVSKVLTGSHTTAQAQSEALKDGVRELDGALASEVLSRNKELLTMVRSSFAQRMLPTYPPGSRPATHEH